MLPAQDVCQELMSRGAQSLPELTRNLELPQARVREALLSLVHQNCVVAFKEPHSSVHAQKGTRTSHWHCRTLYEVEVRRLLQRLRLPRCVVYTRRGSRMAFFPLTLCLLFVEVPFVNGLTLSYHPGTKWGNGAR